MPLVRLATELDLYAASAIYRSSLQDASWLSTGARERADFYRDTEGEAIFVYEGESSEICGFVSVWTESSFIHHLYVDSRFRRLGVGTALLGSLEPWLPQPWSLKCLKANGVALEFYFSLGWNRVGSGESDDGPYWLLQNRQ